MSLLTTPITINQLKVPNRLVMPPMATAKCDKYGTVSDMLCDYYAEKSYGGYIGLIITEHCFVSPEGKASEGQLSIASDDCINGLRRLVDTIHSNNTCVFAQISHSGIAATPKITGLEAIGPSSIAPLNRPVPKTMPREMTKEDILRVRNAFIAAALRAKIAGYDGVEIHSAHSYLLNQFYSPLTNHRTDEYGGPLSNRIRLHIEIIRGIREAVGSDFPIAIRLGACDYIDGGSAIEDAVAACKAFEEAGADLLDISGGFRGFQRPGVTEPGYFKDASEAIRKQVSIPVLLTGGITDGASAEALLADGSADLIGVGRAILKDSNWAKNVITSLI